MKIIKSTLLLCMSLASFFCLSSDVYIETHNEEGQGILRAIGSECLLYTPAHVVARSSDFFVSTRLEKRIKGQLITTYPQDLAVLKLPGSSVSACRESSWKDEGGRVNTILEVINRGVLNIRLNNGRLVTYDVDIINKELHSFFSIRLNHPTKIITKGMSGGIVTVGGYPIGMLLSVKENIGTVLRMDTVADTSRSVVKSYATEKEQIALNMDSYAADKQHSLKELPLPVVNVALEQKAAINKSQKQVFKGRIAAGASETFTILSYGNTAYRLHNRKQSDGVEVSLEYQNPARKRLSRELIRTEREATWGFGTVERGEHFLVIDGRKGSGSYEFELEIIATPEQQLSESNVLGHGDVAKGMIASGTFTVFKILSRGNTAYRLHNRKQSNGVEVSLEYQNPAKKRLSRELIRTDREATWGFGTVERGEHFLVINGRKGSGSYEFELEVIATPEQQLSESNVLGNGDVAKGMIAPGTFAVFKILSRGNTAYRLHNRKQSDGVEVSLEYQNPAKKRLSRELIRTDREAIWGFGTVERGEHFLVIDGRKGSGSYELELEIINE